MNAVLGVLLMVIGVSRGVQTCDGRTNGAQCYGALGGTVVFQLMDDASGIFRFQWTKNKTRILRWNRTKIVYNLIEDRSLFTPIDGTFRINNLISTDSGQYVLQIFDSNGKQSEQRTLQLTIEAPVSSVRLVSECLSQGQKKVSCSSEGGDSPQYSWTLDGHTLTDTELLSGNNETNVIVLNQDVSGRLVCSVRNHVSRVSKDTISTCAFIDCTLSNGTHISQWVFNDTNTLCIEPTTDTTGGKETDTYFSLLICGVQAAVAVVSFVGIVVYFSWKKKKSQRAEGSTVPPKMENPDSSVLMVEVNSEYEL
ncbi:uncharacterized protein LOC113144437 [Mastacembelus armatus]|uniref:uncharacterized protein LOC113144437 n=1 Tax=Mastacembelus armatus TaxID=205130 RepID=UPI000E45E67B|nr:uncharacterized protein LOC113144437 [Mastacembelus armatus]